ncbi:patatin-like phospholipase family protein [Teredinibacter sp. KSP-S5-2]|uniref:patatin-like phospholipase family protein n=1 Tax=Teredinibacter sp. KSP-S5-2 TaxID=3034506 RepID=UPI0029344EF2|nr:patatin-like phospholipase family protein [Teredinibacter sp. KSP-S5-2]WNO09066.1 patatin-like phospholipase family protein [Teredinibacter sp. KSP-S5-2]
MILTELAQSKKNFALALSGGGVKGLAHIALLKEFDRHGLRPSLISGTSMGAIIGALYARGLSGQEIEDKVRSHILQKGEKVKSVFKRRKHLLKWAKVFTFEKSRGGFFTADGLFEHLFYELKDCHFSDLATPFVAVATDFYTGHEVELSQGELLTAVKASMAVPGVFAPVEVNDRLLVDGGVVNNLPVKQIFNKADVTFASDVISLHQKRDPNPIQSLSGSVNIMLRQSTRLQLEAYPVTHLIEPDTTGVELFDFRKIGKILTMSEQSVREQIS